MSVQGKSCPSCEAPWEAEETIYQHFVNRGKTPAEATKSAEMYGCTPENPKHFGINVVGIEIPGKYDGVSFWKCQECETVFDRWTMEPTNLDEKERYGNR